jgi:hypothetical protein
MDGKRQKGKISKGKMSKIKMSIDRNVENESVLKYNSLSPSPSPSPFLLDILAEQGQNTGF